MAIKPFGLVVQLKGTGATGTVAMEALPDGAVPAWKPVVTPRPARQRRYVVGEPIEGW